MKTFGKLLLAISLLASMLVGLWIVGTLICYAVGLSEGLSAALGLLFIPIWFLAAQWFLRLDK